MTVNAYPIFVANAFCPSEGKTTCKLLEKELPLDPVRLYELLVIFCSAAKLLLERKERESGLHVSAIERRMHLLWVKSMGKLSAGECFCAKAQLYTSSVIRIQQTIQYNALDRLIYR